MKHSERNVAKVAAVATALALSQAASTAQTVPNAPSMPNVMPPTISGSFYSPGTSGFYSGSRPAPPYVPQGRQPVGQSRVLTDPQRAQIGADTAGAIGLNLGQSPGQTAQSRVLTDSQKSQIGRDTAGAIGLNPGQSPGQAAQSRVLTDSQRAQIGADTAGAIGLNPGQSPGQAAQNPALNATLTAKDLSSLDSLGLLGKLSGAVGQGAMQEKEDGETLKLILQRLNEIKAGMDAQQSGRTAVDAAERSPQILRFNADGADWTQFVKAVHFSDEEADGTFLLTGDLRYSLGGTATDETFYMLFSSAGGDGGATAYRVTAESSGPSSLFSRLSAKGALSATRTGNLVSFRVNDGDMKMDLLLSMRPIGR